MSVDSLLADYGPCRLIVLSCPRPATVPIVVTSGHIGALPYPASIRTEIQHGCHEHAAERVDPVLFRLANRLGANS